MTISSDQNLINEISKWFADKEIKTLSSLHPRLVMATAAFGSDKEIRKIDVCVFDVKPEEVSNIPSIAKFFSTYEIPLIIVGHEVPKEPATSRNNVENPFRHFKGTPSMSELEEVIWEATHHVKTK